MQEGHGQRGSLQLEEREVRPEEVARFADRELRGAVTVYVRDGDETTIWVAQHRSRRNGLHMSSVSGHSGEHSAPHTLPILQTGKHEHAVECGSSEVEVHPCGPNVARRADKVGQLFAV